MEEFTAYDDEAILEDMDGFGYEDEELGFEDFEELGFEEFAEFEGEADEWGWLKKAWRGVKSIAKKVAPIAKKLAPIAGRVVGGAFGGPAGAMIGGKLGGFLGSLEDEGYVDFEEYEDESDTEDEMEAEDFMSFEGEEEDMAEYMADMASKAPSPTDAAAMAGAVTITILSKAPVQVKKCAPTIASGAARLTKLMKKSPRTAILTKTVPAIAKKTTATLAKKAAKGKAVTPRTAKRVMAKHTVRVLSSGRELTKALAKNEIKKRRINKKAVMRAERFV